MSLSGLALLAVAALAGSDEPADIAAKPLTVHMTAAKATREGREEPYFDHEVRDIAPAVADLKQFDTYRKLKTHRANAPYATETKISIDNQYSLYVHPLSKDSEGRIRSKFRIALKTLLKGKKEDRGESKGAESEEPEEKEKDALRCTLSVAPGKQFKFTGSGLKLEDGQLVVVLSLKE